MNWVRRRVYCERNKLIIGIKDRMDLVNKLMNIFSVKIIKISLCMELKVFWQQ